MDEINRIKNILNEHAGKIFTILEIFVFVILLFGSIIIFIKIYTQGVNSLFEHNQFLNTVAETLFTLLKIFIFTLLLLGPIFIFIKIYTQDGTVILPFDTEGDKNISGSAIADQLTAELVRIQQIHSVKYENFTLWTKSSVFTSSLPTEQSLGTHQLVVPKAEILQLNIGDIGNIDVGAGSLSLGKLIIALKSICPGSKPVTTIRGSLQRYGSTIVLAAILESRSIQSWTLSINNEEHLHEVIKIWQL
jgi:hypothetical protein